MDAILLERGPYETFAGSIEEGPDRQSGVASTRLDRYGSLAAEFQRACCRYATRTALIDGDQAISYAWLYQAASVVRDELATRTRLAPGSPVTILLGNSPEYLAAFYGVLLAGGVVVPLPPRMEARRWRQIQASSGSGVLITREEELAGRPELSLTSRRRVSLTGENEPFGKPLADCDRGGDDLAMVAYTSGSTGLPKGVMLSHRNLLANTQSILDYLPIREDDRTLVVLPFCLAFGNSILQTHLLAGATLVLGGAATFPVSILQALREQRATSLSAVPEVYAMLLRFAALGDDPLPDLRYMAVAGGGLAPELAVSVAERIHPASLYLMYGQTEATARLSYLPPDQLLSRRGSIGRGIPGVQLRVADEAGHPVVPGQTGRLLARGENLMLGYWRDPEATASVLQNGWLDTGDLGTVDQDGYIYLQGRGNLLIKIQGQRIHPREIEDLVVARFPGSRAIVVPYAATGETRLALFLCPPAGVQITTTALRRFCRQSLPHYKVPSHIELLERLPLNDALKVDRNALARRACEQLRHVS